MEPTLKNFLKIFSEFNSVANAKVDFIFCATLERVGKDNFCSEKTYEMAVYLLTAHELTVLDPCKAANGNVTSEKAGDLAISYDTGSGDKADELMSTQYGRQYLRLIKENVIKPQVL